MKSQTCLGTSYWKRKSVWLFNITDYPDRGTWKRSLSNHNDFWKQKILKFFCKRTNNIHEFEGCVLRGQVRSNTFKSFQRLYSWILNFIGPFAKKILRIFCDWTQSSSKCPSSSSRSVKDRYSWLAFMLQQLINSKWRLFMLPMGTSLESLYFFGLHGIDLAGSNFIFLVINRTYEAIGHTFCMSKRGKLYVNFVT